MINFFYSFLSLIIGIFFILLGIICMMIPWDPATRSIVVQFIFENSISIILFGFGFCMIGITVVINLFSSFKKRHYTIRCDNKSVLVDETILQDYLTAYWKQKYPSLEIPNRMTLKRNKIHIFADLPYFPLNLQKETLETIQEDLSELFSKILGYHQQFYLSISFEKEKKVKSGNVQR